MLLYPICLHILFDSYYSISVSLCLANLVSIITKREDMPFEGQLAVDYGASRAKGGKLSPTSGAHHSR